MKLEGVVPQATAKTFLPPGASIWKDRTRMAWNAHMPPRARISEPWGACEVVALSKILKRVWAQHLEIEGLDATHCPWDFD